MLITNTHKKEQIHNKFLIALLIFIGVGLTAQNTGTIQGIIADSETTSPLSLTEVVIVETGQGAVSANNGRFKISDVVAGTYSVKAGTTTTIEFFAF